MLAAHADWSIDPKKRWISIAQNGGAGWRMAVPRPVGDVASLLPRLLAEAGDAPVALGVDFPIGLPRAYAALHSGEFSGFLPFLRSLAHDMAFFHVAETLAQVSAARPFYPQRGVAGMTRAAHAAALGLVGAIALSRACDQATADRPAGAPVFWTLGANQSGKAAINAWRDLLLPALARPDPPRLWPFEGALHTLLAPGRVVVAETYPAEALRHLQLRMAGSKRRRADRQALAPGLMNAMERLSVAPDEALSAALADGFGGDAAGEDRFDTVLGLLCVIGVLAGHRPDSAPDDPWIQRWEGWVLGQRWIEIASDRNRAHDDRNPWLASKAAPALSSSAGGATGTAGG